MMKTLSQIIYVLAFLTLRLCKTPDNTDRVLVLSDNTAIFISHSLLFEEIKNLGYTIEFKNYLSTSFSLVQFGEYNYDHILLFSTTEEELKGLKARELFQFFDTNHNIILLGSPDSSKYFRHILNGFGLDLHAVGTSVYDHFSNIYNSDPLTILTENYLRNTPFLSVTKPIAYRGAGISQSPYETHQVYGIVRGSETAYSSFVDKQEDDTVIWGNNVVLVGAVQGRNNARFVGTGSQDVLSNEFLSNTAYGNLELARSLIQWTFKQKGVLKAGQIVHRRQNSNDTMPVNYRISDDVHFSAEIWEWDNQKQQWVAFKAPEEDDVLVEFIMLDPYYRVPLKANKQKYELDFKVPDKYGIFQFKIDYTRPGYSFLNIAEKITIRPYRHDEYDRYLQQAYPYYLSTFATIAGFLVFVIYFLTHRDEIEKQKQE